MAGSSQAQQIKLLPNDTELIMTINLQQILKSEVVKENKMLVDLAKEKVAEALESKGLAKHLKKAEFDLFKDLGSITIAVPGGRNPEESFVLIEGQFDADKIEEAAVEASKDKDGSSFKVTKIAGMKAFEVSPKDEKTVYIGILNKKTLIAAGTKADFADAVARFKGSKQSSMKDEVKVMLETVNNKQSVSMVATVNVLTKLQENAPQADERAKAAVAALKQIDGVSMAVTMQKNIDFQLGMNAKNADTASEFAKLGNFFIGVTRAKVADQAKQNEKFVPAVEILNTLKATAQGSNLIVRGQISYETLGKIISSIPMQ